MAQVAPDGDGPARDAVLPPLHLAVEEEGAEPARVHVLGALQQELLIELEGTGELTSQLVDAVCEGVEVGGSGEGTRCERGKGLQAKEHGIRTEPLDENGRALVVLVVVVSVATALSELVAERQPLLLHLWTGHNNDHEKQHTKK